MNNNTYQNEQLTLEGTNIKYEEGLLAVVDVLGFSNYLMSDTLVMTTKSENLLQLLLPISMMEIYLQEYTGLVVRGAITRGKYVI